MTNRIKKGQLNTKMSNPWPLNVCISYYIMQVYTLRTSFSEGLIHRYIFSSIRFISPLSNTVQQFHLVKVRHSFAYLSQYAEMKMSPRP